MAHFAKLDKSSKVQQVIVISNDIATTEQIGVDYINNLFNTNDIWKQTSYNTKGGVHKLGGTPFRKNFAGVNFKYDQTRDAFIPPQPYPSWTLNETTCLWEAPVVRPNDNNEYFWNEENQSWDLVE